MSFTAIEQATPRLHRSELAVPGSNPAMFEKAARSAADIVFLDCEDAVAPDDKEQARKNIVEGLNDIDWGAKTMMVRINGLDTHYMYRDVVDIVEACPRLDMILIPKVGVAADVYAIDMLVTQIEAAKKRTRRIGFEVLIETALGMANVEAIAQSSRRLEAMSFGVADYAASTRARTTVIGGVNRDYGVLSDKDEHGKRDYFWGDQWHAAQTRMMVACRAYGLRPIDGPFGDFSDPEGYDTAARRAAVLGYDGKWAIHPSQIELANRVFTPSDAEVSRAQRIMDAMAQAAKDGKGAVSLDGRLIDAASIRMAEALLSTARAIAASSGKHQVGS
ncbi:CoA ester lyase [Paraburkholderia sp. JHI2823]|uniref:HpcH/HpaI aldolase/citrate lyase family protein n=1 Tax=Paraburkholderia TaxID=1822464 RepID=UPI000423FC67|nr:CoA ester lyase [Paraburkholderia mimosarum]